MPTQLDTQLGAIIEGLVQPGMPFETVPFTDPQFNVEMPAFKNAPPSLAHYFAHFCNEHAALEFLVDGDCRLTFGAAWQAASHVAAGLVQNHGVAKGDRVGIVARNSSNWVIAYMGVIMAGGCATLLNGWWTGEELAFGIDLADCQLVLADEPRAKRLDGIDHNAKIVLFDHDCMPEQGLSAVWGEGDTAMQMLQQIGPDDMATILYTSGSTGQSKAAWSDHRGVVHGVFSYVSQSAMAKILLEGRGEDVSAQPVTLIGVPLFHVTGEIPLFLQSYGIGRKIVLMPKWDAGEALKLIEQERVSYFAGVPLMTYEMATHPDRAKYDVSSCKSFAAGGAPRPEEHVNKIKEAFSDGFPLLGYGLTETNAVGCGNFNENYMAKPGSTGPASRPMVDLAILNDDGEGLAQGDVGEVCIRSVANFKGYWKNDEATEEAFFANGYFRTGDLGYLDEDGYLFIVDRKKDIIIRGGENIACPEVEGGIYEHEGIIECSVFGIPDERFGEVPAAVYLPREGEKISPEELREFMLTRLAPFKVPQVEHIWLATEALPRLGTEKIDKRTVRTQFAGELAEA